MTNAMTGKIKCLRSPHSETGKRFNLIEKNKTNKGAKEKIGNDSANNEMNRENLSKLLFFLYPAIIPRNIPIKDESVTETLAKIMVGFILSAKSPKTSLAPKIDLPKSPCRKFFKKILY